MAPSAMTSSLGVEASKKTPTSISEINENFNDLSVMNRTSPTSSTSDLSSTIYTASSHENTIQTPQTPTSPSPDTAIYDLICIGFGPASLAIAIALHDRNSTTYPPQTQTPSSSPSSTIPKVLYLEKQPRFAWHAGMQLPGAKMQISFLKDLATPRLPTSHFTFLNYLHSVGRLDHFINLGTFLPRRREYEDYLRWCARFFEGRGEVRYGCEVESVEAGERDGEGKVRDWVITSFRNGERCTWRCRNVVVAVGGKAVVPRTLQEPGLKGRVFHSSEYAYRIQEILKIQKVKENENRGRNLRFVVIGGGQSAAEIFNDLWDRFREAEVRLVIKGASLRPSDDSPFVNEIFNPSRVTPHYALPPSTRHSAIALDKATNYGVVRLELLEHLYEKMYSQRMSNPNENDWRCQILPNRRLLSAERSSGSDGGVYLRLGSSVDDPLPEGDGGEEVELEVDYVFTATGYIRNAHEIMLERTRELLPAASGNGNGNRKDAEKFEVQRDYRVKFDPEKVDVDHAGIWLQGCNEGTHGLSDTLLSILAVRGGEVAESIFGKKA